jgi:hypothetical protein
VHPVAFLLWLVARIAELHPRPHADCHGSTRGDQRNRLQPYTIREVAQEVYRRAARFSGRHCRSQIGATDFVQQHPKFWQKRPNRCEITNTPELLGSLLRALRAATLARRQQA